MVAKKATKKAVVSKPKSTEVVEPTDLAPLDPWIRMIEKVVMDASIDVLKLEKMLEMQEKIFDKNAKIEYNQAMADAQAEMNGIVARGEGDKGATYAKLEDIINAIKPIYTRHGFALCFGSGNGAPANHYRVECTVSHKGGHSEHFKQDLPIDMFSLSGKAIKIPIHAFGSTNSYGQRYIQKMIFNLAIQDEDNDGNNGQQPGGEPLPYLNDEDYERVKTALQKAGKDEAYMCEKANITELRHLLPDRVKGAIAHLANVEAKLMEGTDDNSQV